MHGCCHLLQASPLSQFRASSSHIINGVSDLGVTTEVSSDDDDERESSSIETLPEVWAIDDSVLDKHHFAIRGLNINERVNKENILRSRNSAKRADCTRSGGLTHKVDAHPIMPWLLATLIQTAPYGNRG